MRVSDISLPGCGEPVGTLTTHATLSVTADFPTRASRVGDGLFEGRVTVTNLGRAVSGVTSPHADVYVVHEDVVVATPQPQDLVAHPLALEAGASTTISARGSLRSCADDQLLPAGRYDLVAVVVVHVGNGPAVVGIAGPCAIEVT